MTTLDTVCVPDASAQGEEFEMKEQSEITEILDRLVAGQVTLDEVAEQFRQRKWREVVKAPASDDLELARRAQEDPASYVPGSFDDVEAAFFRHELTAEQYEVLLEAATESMNRGARDGDQG